MVLPGTKIEVLASSIKNKGPNIGSIGYVVKSWNPMFVPMQFLTHLKEYGAVNGNAMFSKLTLQSIEIVFTRFGKKGRARIKHRTIQHVLIPPSVVSKTDVKWAKRFANAINSYSKGNTEDTAFRLIVSLEEPPQPIEEIPFHDIVAKTYSMLLYLLRSRNFLNVTVGEVPEGLVYYRRSLKEAININQGLLTKRSWAVLREIALDTKYDDAYKQELHERFMHPAIVAIRAALSHELGIQFRKDIKTLGGNVANSLFLLDSALVTQILNNGLNPLNRNRFDRASLAKNLTKIEDMKNALRSLSTAR